MKGRYDYSEIFNNCYEIFVNKWVGCNMFDGLNSVLL